MDPEFQRHDAKSAKDITSELVDVYAKVYDVPPYIGDPFFSADSFRARLEAAYDSLSRRDTRSRPPAAVS